MKFRMWLMGLVIMAGLMWGGLGVSAQAGEKVKIPRVQKKLARQEFAQGRLILKFKVDLTTQGAEREVGRGRVWSRLGESGELRKVVVVMLPHNQDVLGAVASYKDNPNVEYAEPDFVRQKFWVPNDPYFANGLGGYQWNMAKINMSQAWDIAPRGGSSSVKVAVIDTGVAFENYTDGAKTFAKAPELNGVTFVNPRKYTSEISCNSSCSCNYRISPLIDAHPNDQEGHGTHVTGTIAQATNNGSHSAGIAFNTSIMPIKVLESCGGISSNIVLAINYAADSGAKVINMSLGGGSYTQAERDAIRYANSKGAVVVVATGNSASRSSSPPISYPAAYPETIAVGATRYDNARAYYSQYAPVSYSGGPASENFSNRLVDIVAPGGQIVTDDEQNVLDQNGDSLFDGIVQQTFVAPNYTTFTSINNNHFGYWCVDSAGYLQTEACGLLQGTSMATPHVSGVAALMYAANPGLTPDQVKAKLKSTANHSFAGYLASQHGSGLVDAYAALNLVVAKSPDFTGDGKVTINDVALILSRFTASQIVATGELTKYDLDSNGYIEAADVNTEVLNYPTL